MKQIDGVDPTEIRRMVEDLAEARIALGNRTTREVTVRDERAFAQQHVRGLIEQLQRSRLQAGRPKLGSDAQAQLLQAVLDTSFHGAQLWRVWNDFPDATNLSVYGTGPARLELADGTVLALPPIANSNDELRAGVKGLRSIAGRPDARWDPTSPELELIIADDGTRITAVDFVCPQPFVTLRRPTLANVTLDDLVENETLSAECARFLTACIEAGQRILIAGSMNAGKTVMLRAMASCLRSDAAVMVAESQPELRLEKFPDTYPSFVVSMVARRPNSEGKNGVTVRDLVTHIQRMSPSVVIVGEVRGPEAAALAASLAQGYQVMSTIHASSASNAVSNAALYYQEQTGTDYETSLARLAMGVDIVVFMDRRRSDNQRIVAEVAAIAGVIEGVMKYELIFNAAESEAQMTGVMPEELSRALARVGYAKRDLRVAGS